MKINITKKEYRTLLEIVEIANWVLYAHKTEEEPETEKYRELEQKLLSYAKEMGLKHFVKYEKKLEKYFLTKEFEDKSPFMDYIDDYNNNTFWDELVDRLSFRDLIRQEGEEKYREMSLMERFQKEDPIREKYYNEFQINGLNNIRI
jgi:hypothetical protein